MKKVIDLWYFGTTNAPNGVASFIRAIQAGFRDDEDVDLKLYSNNDIVVKAQHNNLKQSVAVWLKWRINKLLSSLAGCSFFFGWIIYYIKFRNAKKLIRNYPQSPPENILFFNDLITAFIYFKVHKTASNSSIIAWHGGGKIWNMIYETYPSLAKSKLFTRYMNRIASDVFNRCEKIVLLSHAAKAEFIQNYPALEKKIHVIYNGINDLELPLDPAKRADSKLRMISVGTISKRKGFDLLVEAVKRLPANLQGAIQIDLVGDGPLVENLKSECNRHSISCFRFLGTRKDVDALLASADVFLLVSREEGMPIAVLEAFRMSKPVLLTDVGGMVEMVMDGVNGFLCTPTVESVKQSLEQLIRNAERLDEMGQQSRDLFLTKFSYERMIGSYKALFTTG